MVHIRNTVAGTGAGGPQTQVPGEMSRPKLLIQSLKSAKFLIWTQGGRGG
jgi:hypothetical protein